MKQHQGLHPYNLKRIAARFLHSVSLNIWIGEEGTFASNVYN